MPGKSARPTSSAARRRRVRRCKHTVLWVDDDPNVSAAFARRLLRYSIRVVPASDGMQGYWMALTKSPDAIVTDLRMPRWEGEELVDCLKHNATTRAIPTIVLSGYVADFSENFRTDYGIDAVLEKPIALEKLLATLRSCWASGPGSASVESRRTLLQGA